MEKKKGKGGLKKKEKRKKRRKRKKETEYDILCHRISEKRQILLGKKGKEKMEGEQQK